MGGVGRAPKAKNTNTRLCREAGRAGSVSTCWMTTKPIPAWMAPSTVLTPVVTTMTTKASESWY